MPGQMASRALVSALVMLDVVRETLRRHWRRMLVGAFVGWALATVIGALALALLDPYIAGRTSDVWAFVFVYGGVIAGAAVGYSWREAPR